MQIVRGLSRLFVKSKRKGERVTADSAYNLGGKVVVKLLSALFWRN